jgi:hypothetical protein
MTGPASACAGPKLSGPVPHAMRTAMTGAIIAQWNLFVPPSEAFPFELKLHFCLAMLDFLPVFRFLPVSLAAHQEECCGR